MKSTGTVGLLLIVLVALVSIACGPAATEDSGDTGGGSELLTTGSEDSLAWVSVDECISDMQIYFTAPEWNRLNTRGTHLGEKACRDAETFRDMSPQIRLAILWTSILRAQAIGLNLETEVDQNTRCRTQPDLC